MDDTQDTQDQGKSELEPIVATAAVKLTFRDATSEGSDAPVLPTLDELSADLVENLSGNGLRVSVTHIEWT